MRHRNQIAATLSAGLSLLAVAVPARAEVEGRTERKAEAAAHSAAEDINDSWITSKAKIALYADSRVSGTRVNVETQRGVVTIRGKVDSAEAKAAADETVKAIEGVKEVRNQLQVVTPGSRKVVEAKDDLIKERIEKQIARDPALKQAKIDVRSDAGVVTLTGTAPSWSASARASEMARNIEGVKSVKNSLTVPK